MTEDQNWLQGQAPICETYGKYVNAGFVTLPDFLKISNKTKETLEP